MNSLSWLIYLISIVSGLSLVLGALSFILMIATVGFTIAMLVSKFDNSVQRNTQIEIARYWRNIVIALSATVILLIVIPEPRTIKLIAASEISEYLIKTETGQQVIDEASKQIGKSGEIVTDSLNLLHQYIKNELQSNVQNGSVKDDKQP